MASTRRCRILTVIAGLVLCLAGCATKPVTSRPQAAVSTSTTSMSSPVCLDFATGTYVTRDLASANNVRSLGWSIQLWDEVGSASWESGANGRSWMIGEVSKDAATCVARFKVVPGVSATTTTVPTTTVSAPTGPLSTVSDGTHLVGTDMLAGSYKSTGPTNSEIGCYWARLKDDSGSKIIANNLTKGPARFTTKNGEYVEIANCTFTKV